MDENIKINEKNTENVKETVTQKTSKKAKTRKSSLVGKKVKIRPGASNYQDKYNSKIPFHMINKVFTVKNVYRDKVFLEGLDNLPVLKTDLDVII